MDSDQEQALDLVETKDLVNALKRRCRALVVVMNYQDEKRNTDCKEWYAFGGYYQCFGLVCSLAGLMFAEESSGTPIDCEEEDDDSWKNG